MSQGTGRKGFMQQVGDFVNLYHPDVLFFIEKKLILIGQKRIIKYIITLSFLKYHLSVSLEIYGFSGKV